MKIINNDWQTKPIKIVDKTKNNRHPHIKSWSYMLRKAKQV